MAQQIFRFTGRLLATVVAGLSFGASQSLADQSDACAGGDGTCTSHFNNAYLPRSPGVAP